MSRYNLHSANLPFLYDVFFRPLAQFKRFSTRNCNFSRFRNGPCDVRRTRRHSSRQNLRKPQKKTLKYPHVVTAPPWLYPSCQASPPEQAMRSALAAVTQSQKERSTSGPSTRTYAVTNFHPNMFVMRTLLSFVTHEICSPCEYPMLASQILNAPFSAVLKPTWTTACSLENA